MDESRGTRLARRIVYTGKVFDVTVDRVRMPYGREVDMEVVRHRGSVVIIPQPDPQHLILLKQYRYAIDRWVWELPAGSLDPSEAPDEAARRECHEEIGLVPESLERLATLYPTPGFCDEQMIFFRATDLRRSETAAALDPDEHLEPKTVSLDEVAGLVRSGTIVDMKTLVGLQLITGGWYGRRSLEAGS